jgi:Tfp pilus assembly protein PilO
MAPEHKQSRYYTYIEPVLKTPLVKTYGSLILSILALVVFIVFAIKPTLETISNLQKELDVKTKTLADLNKKSEDLTLAQKNLNSLPSDTKLKLQTTLPTTVQVAGLVKSLEASTRESQATISALQFQPLVIEPEIEGGQDPILQEIPFVYTMENSYEIVNAILTNLRTNPRLLVIDNFAINTRPDSTNLLLSVTGRAFYIK